MLAATATANPATTNQATEEEKALTSIRIFRRSIVQREDHEQGKPPVLDAEGVLSRECYELWLRTRRTPPPNPERAFQRALSAHLGALDGRTPFTAEEERAILKTIRKYDKWPCFQHSQKRYGLMKYRTKGFHERQAPDEGENKAQQTQSTATTSPKRPITGPKSTKDHHEPAISSPTATTISGTSLSDQEEQYSKRLRTGPKATAGEEDDQSDYEDKEVEDLIATDPAISSFWNLGKMALKTLVNAPMDVWETVLSVRRLILISKGHFDMADPAFVNRMLERESLAHPNEAIMILDPVAKQPKLRFLAVNSLGEEFIGKVTAKDGGVRRRLFPTSEYLNILKHTVHAWCKKGRDVRFACHIHDRHMRLRHLELVLNVTPENDLTVVRSDLRELD